MRKFYRLTEFKKYHDSKNRTPLTSVYGVTSGEVISIWDSEIGRNVEFEVHAREGYEGILICKPLEKMAYEMIRIDVAKHMVFVLNSNEFLNLKGCQCGSKHTSAPNVHMFYCPLWTAPK